MFNLLVMERKYLMGKILLNLTPAKGRITRRKFIGALDTQLLATFATYLPQRDDYKDDASDDEKLFGTSS